ncbi:MAG: peptidylprolyl isomerase [Chitinivibrionales bacterium]|nr:peptidylprolyl isomerase [Chitinivibrionales bacterium]
MKVEKNKIVSFHYTLRLDSGEIYDSTTADKPKHILVGHDQVIPGMEKAIMGMKIGEKKSGTIEPQDAFGFIDEKLVKAYPLTMVPPNITLHIGQILSAQKKNGQEVTVVVKSHNDTQVVLDANHPIAGERLSYKTKIVDIREATQEELQSEVAK